MAINYKEAQKIVNSGNADHAVGRFLQFVLRAYASGLHDENGMLDDMLVVSALLHKLLATAEGKRVMRRNYRGKHYTPERYGFPSPEMDIAMELLHGLISRKSALEKLTKQLADHRDEHPDRKTLETLLNDLEDHADFFLRNMSLIAADRGWDGRDVAHLGDIFAEIMDAIGGKNHGKH